MLIKSPFLTTLYFEGQDEMFNTMYEQSKKRVHDSIERGDYGLAVALVEKPFRVEVLQELYNEGRIDKSNPDYWETVFNTYTGVEFTTCDSDVWLDLMDGAQAHKDKFMSEDELSVIQSLPDVVTVYRGAKEDTNEMGISFSLDYKKAEWFAQRFDSDSSPVVVEAKVKKEDILAYLENRGESEIIFDNAKALSWNVYNLDYESPNVEVDFLDKIKGSINTTPEDKPEAKSTKKLTTSKMAM